MGDDRQLGKKWSNEPNRTAVELSESLADHALVALLAPRSLLTGTRVEGRLEASEGRSADIKKLAERTQSRAKRATEPQGETLLIAPNFPGAVRLLETPRRGASVGLG